VDFGLAKVLHGSQATTTGARAMTPGYSPPEQYGTARTDPRTDIYSLGATMYAALSGIIPEDGLARAMDNTQLTPLRKRNSKVSRRLATAIEKAMGIDPADRFQNGEDFKRALLGSKSKTQRLPGDYIIPPPPLEALEEPKQNPIEKESLPLANVKADPKIGNPLQEAPVFRPKRKKRRSGRLLSSVILILFLLAVAIISAARFMPALVPAELRPILLPFNSIPLPFLSSTNTPVSQPSSTASKDVLETPTIAITTTSQLPTSTQASAPTTTPTAPFTATTDSTPLPQATLIGGGMGQIAFASDRTGLPQIFFVNLDGTNLLQLTNQSSGACQPSWSPDGSQLVFTSPCRDRGDFLNGSYSDSSLFMMNADGTGLKQLTNVPGADFDPDWSPDGNQIAFTSIRGGSKQIYTLDVNSLAVTRLTQPDVNVENSQPAWSPDGNEIAYLAKRVGTYQVWVMSSTGQANEQLARSGQSLWDYLPTWSSDGKVILFSQRNSTGNRRPWLMSMQYEERSSAARLSYFPTPIEDVEFSPDGYWLLLEGMDNEGNRDVYLMTITGGNRTRITNDPAVDFDPTWRPVQTP
jgi:Tol biopolymer transport system component